jgi:hypothetical protein
LRDCIPEDRTDLKTSTHLRRLSVFMLKLDLIVIGLERCLQSRALIVQEIQDVYGHQRVCTKQTCQDRCVRQLKHHRANETTNPSAHTCHNMRGVASTSEGDCERRGGIPALAEGSYFRHIVTKGPAPLLMVTCDQLSVQRVKTTILVAQQLCLDSVPVIITASLLVPTLFALKQIKIMNMAVTALLAHAARRKFFDPFATRSPPSMRLSLSD